MNALYSALLSLWLGEEVKCEEVLGREECSEEEVRGLIADLWVRCYPEGDARLCVYSYKRPPREPVPLLLDARGTVIAWTKDGPELVAYPFHKFFNVGELPELRPERLPKPLKAYQKLDGTMVSVFEYDGKVRAATRKRLDVDSPFAKKALELFEGEVGDKTIVFELLGPGCGSPWVGGEGELFAEPSWKLVPLAYRDMRTLSLYPLDGPPSVKVESVEDAMEKAERYGEGLVLWFEVGKQRPLMVKVKSPKYERLVDLLKLGYEGLARIIVANKLDDALPLLKEEVRERALEVARRLPEIERMVKEGRFGEEVEEWLLIDPAKAVEEAVRICLERGC